MSDHLFLAQFSSTATRQTYQIAIRLFTEACGGKEPALVTVEDVLAWKTSMSNQKPNTQYTRWVAVKSYFSWLVRCGTIAKNPFELVRGPSRVANYTPRIPTDEAVRAILAWEATTPRDYRDKTVVTLCANGLRIAEICSLGWEDVQIEGNEVTLRVLGKGQKERIVPLSVPAARAMALWHDARGYPQAGPVFTDYVSGSPMTTRQVQSAFGRITDLVGVKGLSPHALRHHYATRLIRAGVDVFSVQKLLGHSSVSTTQVYVNLDISDLKRAAALDKI